MTATVLEIALPVPRGEVYDYHAPDEETAGDYIGRRVEVVFGRRKLHGLVVGQKDHSQIASHKLRPITQFLDASALVDEAWLDLLRFTSRYYQTSLGMSIATAMPSALRLGKQAAGPKFWALSEAGLAADLNTLKRSPGQRRVMEELKLGKPLSRDQLDVSHSTLKALADKAWIQNVQAPAFQAAELAAQFPQLTGEQARACEKLKAETGFHSHLLYGVTGSGKTEIYLNLARHFIAQGQQCLFLVPEIGLTPQMVERISSGTGARVCALHSGLADGERLKAWMAAAQGEVDIVLGTRSAIFTMLKNPGLIIVDEEHDSSFKQQDGLRYHARDLAVRRAQQLNIPVILGSATPSLESLRNVELGRYQQLDLKQRHGAAGMPKLGIIDLRQKQSPEGLSEPLIARIRAHLARGSQVLLFVNRRGFAPVMLCHDCGWSAVCERCDARLVSHKDSHSLRCHHCGHQRRQLDRCPDCQGSELRFIGQGTQRIEAALGKLFPDAPALRFDRDILSRKGTLERALEQIRSGEIRLIIGTQMLAKGHDFPELGLVGIIDADQGLYGSDFRATEHFAQLLVQVAGRAGRRDAVGEVCLQTHQPEHPLILALKNSQGDNYLAIALGFLRERAELAWPPYSRISLVRAEANKASLALQLLNNLSDTLSQQDAVDILGPIPAAMERRAGHFRYQLLLRSADWKALQVVNRLARQYLEQSKQARNARWSLDVDPQFLD